MMIPQSLALCLVVLATVQAQTGPSGTYLPPGSGGGSGAGGYGGSGSGGAGGGGNGGNGDGPPQPFSFSYEVKDDASGNDYSHRADSDGSSVTGEYQVLLPDGRRQTVTYTANQSGYNADVQYEGEATYGGGAGSGASGPGGAGAGASGPGGAGGGYPSGRPSGAGATGGGSNGYPSGRPNGAYLPPGK